MSETPYISLVDFTQTWTERAEAAGAGYGHPEGPPLELLEDLGLRQRIEDVLDTVVALQRADWLQEGVYLGPRSMPDVYHDLLSCARELRVAVPPAVIGPCSPSSQAVFGTDGRAYLHLSSFFMPSAASAQRRFVAGRLLGHVHTRQVTWGTLYALLVDHNGARAIARRAIGPALEVILAPISLGARLALSRWHRAAEITADRAGLLCAGELDAAGMALLRMALGVRPDISPEEYLERVRARNEGSPGRWAEILSGQPWLHKRMRALELFARSEPWVALGREPIGEPILSRAELDKKTAKLLKVG